MKRVPVPDVHSVMERIQKRLLCHNEEEYLRRLRALPRPHRSIWSTSIVQCEVENGGFAQYFWNIEAEGFYDEAESGFRALGALCHLEIFRGARALITPYLAIMHTWQGANDRFSKYKPMLKKVALYDQFWELDCRFYDQRPALPELWQQYITAHAEALSI